MRQRLALALGVLVSDGFSLCTWGPPRASRPSATPNRIAWRQRQKHTICPRLYDDEKPPIVVIMIRSRVDTLFMLAFGLFALWQSIQLPLGSFKAPGPGFFPVGLSLVIVLISLTLLVRNPKKSVHNTEETYMGVRKMILTFSGLVAYAFLLELLGFVISTFGLTFFLLWVVQKARWPISIFLAATTTLLSRVVFESFLGVPFPRGFLGF